MKMTNNLPLKIIAAVGMLVIVLLTLMAPSLLKKNTSNEKPLPNVAYVDITDSGFVPADIKITRNMTITWRNKTESAHQVAANPYPSRSDLPGLYSESYIQPTAEYSYTFTEEGIVGYNDYLHPMVIGKVTVVDKE